MGGLAVLLSRFPLILVEQTPSVVGLLFSAMNEVVYIINERPLRVWKWAIQA